MATQPTTGDGLTAGTAYLVETAEHIDYMRVEPGAFYEFNNRDTIDLDSFNVASPYYDSGAGWLPIGEDAGGDFAFTGSIEGNGAKILNVNINRTSAYVGLIRELDGGTINDLQVSGDVTTSDVGAAVLVALIREPSSINRCKVYGSATSNKSFGNVQTGGLGYIDNGEVRDCYSEVDVSDGGNGTTRVGGFVGWIQATDEGGTFTGKVCVDRCYSDGVVSGASAEGFAGSASQIGDSDDVLNSFWNTDLSTKSTGGTSTGLTGLTTAQFTDISNFTGAGWDIVAEASHDGQFATAVWYHDGTKPRLWYEIPAVTEYTGNFSPDSTAVQDANVYLTVSDDEAFTNGETYYTTTDANGDWTIAQTPDDTKFVRVDIDYDDAGTRKQVSFYYTPI